MKKLFALFALIILAVTPLCLVGCKSKYDNLSIELEENFSIVLGQDENDSITVQARVNGASDDNGRKLSFSPDNDRLVKISQDYKNGINYITLKALAPGKVNIEARTLEGGATKNFVVNIIQPIKNFTVKNDNFVVVRGGEWKVDIEKNLDLDPVNTTQTDFIVSFASNQDINGLSIENNVLSVSKDSKQEEVVLSLASASNEGIAPKDIKLTVLDDFVEIDKQTQAGQSDFGAGSILVFEKNESMLFDTKLEEINIVSNVLSESERQVVVRVYATKKVDVNAVENSRLSVKSVSKLESLDAAGKLQYTDFIFAVRFADVVSSGTTTNLDFVAKYVDFDLSKKLSSIRTSYELAPKTLLINDQDDLSEFTLYNFYSTAKRGQKLQFGVLPTSVSSANSKMILCNKSDLVDAFDYVQFFRDNGEEVFEGDEISANETIYARAKSGINTGLYEVVVQTKYVNPQTNAPLSKVLKFNIFAGITGMKFVDEDQINIQLNASTASAEIKFDVLPSNVDTTKIHVEETDGLTFSKIARIGTTPDKTTLKFTVTANRVGDHNIKVVSENGLEITKKISVMNALKSVGLSVPSPNENPIVGNRQIYGGELHYVATSLGGSVDLTQSISPQDAHYRLEYSYFETDARPEFGLSTYEYPNIVSATSVGVLDYSQLLSYGKIVAVKEGYAVIRAKYTPIGIVDNAKTDLEPIYKFFIVQGYKPIRSIFMSSNYERLYSLESVGAYKKSLATTQFSLSVIPTDATYANNIEWSYDKSGNYFDFDKETLTVVAKQYYSGTIRIEAKIKELNRTYSQILSIVIVDAKRVSDIGVSGIGDSIYIENTDNTDKTFMINAVAFPTDAFNQNLRYDFVDVSGNKISTIKISDSGIMTIPAGVGVNGFVRIAAEDCFQETSTGEYEPVGTEGKNIIMIPTVIANGTSKETAIRINTKEELQKIDTTKHYKIYNDLDVSGISFENFSGGLYGANSESRIVISGVDKTFIKTLETTGCVEDLEINYDATAENQGIFIGENKGYVNNIVVKGAWTGEMSFVKDNYGKIYNVTSEVLFDGSKFAGIAFANFGEIYNCKFMGAITASNQAAGIVLSNSGLVDNCATLLVETSFIKLSDTPDSQAKLAGLCVENLSNGSISRSYVHSYKSTSAFTASDAEKVCGFVHTNDGKIQKCFSALNDVDLVTGFVRLNKENATIENCYSNTTFAESNGGTIKNCFSVLDDERLNAATDCYSGTDATSKTVRNWLDTNWDISSEYARSTIWKIYLDSQNPFLREVAAEVKPDSMSISIKEPKNNNSYIKLSDNQVVLYFYESQVSPLTVAEKTKLNTLNSMSIYDLLTFEIMPYSASSSPDMFNYTLSDGSALKMSGLNIVVLGLGKQTLTITSKLNSELSYTLDIFTTYPIRNFNIFASSSSFDLSKALTNDTIIRLKRSYTQPLFAKISNSIVLVDREINFATHDVKMSYTNSTDPVALGLYILTFDTAQKIDDFICALDFSTVSPYGAFDDIKTTLSSIFARNFVIDVYNGAENLLASQVSFQLEPIDSIELKVTIKTDLFGDNTELEDVKEIQPIKYEIYNEKGINFSEYFVVDSSITSYDKLPDSAGFRNFVVRLVVGLKEKTSTVSGKYRIFIYPNEVGNSNISLSTNVLFELLPQSIQRIDHSHYYAESTIESEGETRVAILKSNLSPSNALAPGQVGLLEINVFPTYSSISRVEIESIENEGHTVKFQLYQRRSTATLNEFVMVQQNANYWTSENTIKVGYTMITNGTIYLKTYLSSNIPKELTFEIVVRAYRSDDDQDPIVQKIFLAAKFIPSATVELDGQTNYAVMGRGTTKDMKITVVGEGDVSIYVDDGGNSDRSYDLVYVGRKVLESQENLGVQNKYIWSCPIYVGSKFQNGKSDVVTIRVVVSRDVNGVREKKTTTLTIRVLDFVVNKVALTNGTNKYSSKVSVKTKFDFSYDISEPQAFTNEEEDKNAVEALKRQINSFKNAQYFTEIQNGAYVYEKSFMFVDELGDHLAAIKRDSGYEFDQNKYIKFEDIKAGEKYEYTTVSGLSTGTQKMKIKVSAFAENSSASNVEIYSIIYEFDVVVTNYSNEDKPQPIGSLDDFNAIFNQSEAQDYILTNDIEIFSHVIFSNTSKIRSLDGNNHKITIKSLNLGNNKNLNVALFNIISEGTTIKNLIVDYQIGEIDANSDQFSSISVAGLALENEGIVTNTHVLSSKGTSTQTTGGLQISSQISQSTQIQMAGFVLNNAGSITNSRVGDTEVTIVDTNGISEQQSLKIFALVGQDQMAGFVLNNTGIISASYAKNITIKNLSNTESQTAGFVLTNQSNAKITGSYVRGVESLNKSDVYVLGEGIESSFDVAGFVFNNFSYILDCYSNIKLYKETAIENQSARASAGFVYSNEIGAQIVSCLSLCKIIESDTSHEYFCGVDQKNQSNNKGTITYSYYYSPNGIVQSVSDGAELLDSATVKQQVNYYGYVFTNAGSLDGMWIMTKRGPELVSANNIAISKRYSIVTEESKNDEEEENKYDYAYVANYEYGSFNNPILIRSAKEFNEVFGKSKDDSIKKYFDATNKQAFGNYRIINDIDLDDLSLDTQETLMLSSTSFTLTRKVDEFGAVIGHGILEGNSMTISNLNFSSVAEKQPYFGLFAAFKNGAVVKNLNLTVKDISASKANFVGALAGYVEDSKVINVNAQIAQGLQVARVQGNNIVGGVVGAVSGTSELNNVTSSISAYATYVDSTSTTPINNNDNGTEGKLDDDICVLAAIPKLPSESQSINSTVSIAGSVAGAVYAKDTQNSANTNLDSIDHAQVQKIKASGKILINAKIVGGLIGYVGKTTYVHDAWLSISEGQHLIASADGVAGGAVGISHGKLSHIRIEHNNVQDYTSSASNIQTEIERGVQDYYTGKSNDRKTYEDMFIPTLTSSNKGQTIGGIVGVMNGGILEDSYTKLDVISDTAFNLGGIAGIVKNSRYEISRVYTFSNVQSKSTEKNVLVGGLFGAVLSYGELDTVVGVNYLDKNYTTEESAKEKYVAFAPFAGAVTYSPNMTNAYVLSGVFEDGAGKINDNKGANVTSAKVVTPLTTTLGSLFPAKDNAANVNDVFKIEDSHFKNTLWARNVDDVLPHLTFGIEEQYFIIDSVNTAGDIRKMVKNSNKTFYIDGEVDLTKADVKKAVQEVRESITFTGQLLGMPKEMNPNHPNEDPTLIGLQGLFHSAQGAIFQGFTVINPQTIDTQLPTSNFGVIAGYAKDCMFSDIRITNNEGGAEYLSTPAGEIENAGILVGFADGKTSFESISISNITLKTGSDKNVGLIAGKTQCSGVETIFKDCSVTDCAIESSSAINVGGFVGYAYGAVAITGSSLENPLSKLAGVTINVTAQYVGGLVGNGSTVSLKATSVGPSEKNNNKIEVKGGENDAYVGGLVGKSITLNVVLISDINFDSISLTSDATAFFGGIAGHVDMLSISKQQGSSTQGSSTQSPGLKINKKTGDSLGDGLVVKGKNVYAGGVVGQVNGTANIVGLLVNTQGEIKNQVLSIKCAGKIYAGGLVGDAQNAIIQSCWSGTDVEISNVTKDSQVWFGGIVGSVTAASGSGTEGNVETDISKNVSYGRFYLDSDKNIKTINAGGIVGKITKSNSDQSLLTPIKDNKTLTSLEIRRRATTHNVNAVAGSRDNVGGSDNAYTYQLSLAVESDTDFATNHSNYSDLLGELPKTNNVGATLGSILNPFTLTTIEQNGYYSYEGDCDISIDDKYISSDVQDANNNFVIIGNGHKLGGLTHIDNIHSRSIISGATIEGKFTYAAEGSDTYYIDGKEYVYDGTYLVGDDGRYELKNNYGFGEWQDLKKDTTTKYYYEDNGKIYVDIDENNKEKINGTEYYIVDISGTSYAITTDKKNIYSISETTTYSCKIGEKTETFEDSDIIAVTIDGGNLKEATEETAENDMLVGVEIAGTLYQIVESDEGDYLADASGNKIKNTGNISSTTKTTISENKELKSESTSVDKLNSMEIENAGYSYSINGITYGIYKIGSTEYARNDKNQVARVIITETTVTIGSTTYRFDRQKSFFYRQVHNIFGDYEFLAGWQSDYLSLYLSLNGFVTENNGFICGVVVKSNYSSSAFGGFVTTNNGAILYSSMNGQVNSTDSNEDVAGFVLLNNGIVDYCHSTGAVQGVAKNSYSFGVNASTGAITNSYTIMLNETSGIKSVFANNGGTFSNNEYDPVGTEVDQTLTELSNGLTDSLYSKTQNCIDSALGNNEDGYWEKQEIKRDQQSYNYGYKTLSAGPFADIGHLSIPTGNGSTDTPFIIANSRMLSKINEIQGYVLSYSYELANNIDCSKLVGEGVFPAIMLINQGCVFNGNNKIIFNVKIDTTKGVAINNTFYYGLFQYVRGTIKNLTMENCYMEVAKEGENSIIAGLLAGLGEKDARFENITINHNKDKDSKDNDIMITGQYKICVGGVIGELYGGAENVVTKNLNIQACHTFKDNSKVEAKTPNEIGWIGFDKKPSRYYVIIGGVCGLVHDNNKLKSITSDAANINSEVQRINIDGLSSNWEMVDIFDYLDYIAVGSATKHKYSNREQDYITINPKEGGKTRYTVGYAASKTYITSSSTMLYDSATFSLKPDINYKLKLREFGLRRDDYYSICLSTNERQIQDESNWTGKYNICLEYSCNSRFLIDSMNRYDAWVRNEESILAKDKVGKIRVDSSRYIMLHDSSKHGFEIWAKWLNIETTATGL